jgi:hypothetical protein
MQDTGISRTEAKAYLQSEVQRSNDLRVRCTKSLLWSYLLSGGDLPSDILSFELVHAIPTILAIPTIPCCTYHTNHTYHTIPYRVLPCCIILYPSSNPSFTPPSIHPSTTRLSTFRLLLYTTQPTISAIIPIPGAEAILPSDNITCRDDHTAHQLFPRAITCFPPERRHVMSCYIPCHVMPCHIIGTSSLILPLTSTLTFTRPV